MCTLTYETSTSETANTDDEDSVDADELVLLKEDNVLPPVASLAYDVLYRPAELESTSMWDMCTKYEKVSKRNPTSNHNTLTPDDTECEFVNTYRTDYTIIIFVISKYVLRISSCASSIRDAHDEKKTLSRNSSFDGPSYTTT